MGSGAPSNDAAMSATPSGVRRPVVPFGRDFVTVSPLLYHDTRCCGFEHGRAVVFDLFAHLRMRNGAMAECLRPPRDERGLPHRRRVLRSNVFLIAQRSYSWPAHSTPVGCGVSARTTQFFKLLMHRAKNALRVPMISVN